MYTSRYGDKVISDTQIYMYVGYNYYSALYIISPELYYQVSYPLKTQQGYIETVQTLMLEYNYTPCRIKEKLVSFLATGIENEISKALTVRFSEKHLAFKDSYGTWCIWLILIVLFVLFIVFTMWKMDFFRVDVSRILCKRCG